MRVRWLWLLLIVSLALNVFFVGGVVYKQWTTVDSAGRGAGQVAALAATLELSDGQQAGLTALREKAVARRDAMRSGWRSGRKALLAELDKPALDRARISALMAENMAGRSGQLEEMLVDLHTYLQTLSPKQRQTLLTMAEDRSLFRSLFGGRSRQSAQR